MTNNFGGKGQLNNNILTFLNRSIPPWAELEDYAETVGSVHHRGPVRPGATA